MPTQQIRPSPTRYSIASLAKIGIAPDELGRPTPWSNLVRKSPPADLQYTSQLLADIEKPSARDFLAGLADGELCFVADFLNGVTMESSDRDTEMPDTGGYTRYPSRTNSLCKKTPSLCLRWLHPSRTNRLHSWCCS